MKMPTLSLLSMTMMTMMTTMMMLLPLVSASFVSCLNSHQAIQATLRIATTLESVQSSNDGDCDNNNGSSSKKYPIMANEEDIMNPKAHGTSPRPVQPDLRWGMDFETADRICNFNRRYAEYRGYATNLMNFLSRQAKQSDDEVPPPTCFYDSVTGNLLFTAPVGRSWQDFVEESLVHGWPSFRDDEVNWEYVRCLAGPEEECVSITGTHLGHNLPDEKGNRYCINLVSIAGHAALNANNEDANIM